MGPAILYPVTPSLSGHVTISHRMGRDSNITTMEWMGPSPPPHPRARVRRGVFAAGDLLAEYFGLSSIGAGDEEAGFP